MPKFQIWQPGPHIEKTDLPMLQRVEHNGANITQSAISSIALTVKHRARATGIVSTTVDAQALTVSNVVFDALQTAARWQQDAAGYNFAHTIDADAFPSEGMATIIYVFTPASGSPFPVMLHVPILSSDGVL